MLMTVIVVSKIWYKITLVANKRSKTLRDKIILYTLSAIYILFFLASVAAVITITVSNDNNKHKQSFIHWLAFAGAIFSIAIFIYSLIGLYSNISKIYVIKADQRKQIKYLIIIYICAGSVRIIFNLLSSIIPELLLKIKDPDDNCKDKTVSWAFVTFFLYFISDLLPSYMIAKLFNPQI